MKHTNEEREFIAHVQRDFDLSAEQATGLADTLQALAAKHQVLCLMDMEEGLSQSQSEARDAIEEEIQGLLHGAAGAGGHGLVAFIYDPSGSTVGIHLPSKSTNSLFDGGCWKVPVSKATIVGLDRETFWKEHLTTAAAANAPHAG